MKNYSQDFFESAGFEVVQTGGGCEAWEKLAPGLRILITDESGSAIPVDNDIITVGFYSDIPGFEVEPLLECECTTPAAALAAVEFNITRNFAK